MSVMPQHAYHPAAAGAYDWNFFSSYAATSGGFPSPYDFARSSPNTSSSGGGSDESMNQGGQIIDPKRNPKYLEKRAKNNEAARKSRMNRKQRENGYQRENEELKARVAALEEEKEALQKIATDAMKQNAELRKRLAEAGLYQHQPAHPFRDVTNMQPNYVNL